MGLKAGNVLILSKGNVCQNNKYSSLVCYSKTDGCNLIFRGSHKQLLSCECVCMFFFKEKERRIHRPNWAIARLSPLFWEVKMLFFLRKNIKRIWWVWLLVVPSLFAHRCPHPHARHRCGSLWRRGLPGASPTPTFRTDLVPPSWCSRWHRCLPLPCCLECIWNKFWFFIFFYRKIWMRTLLGHASFSSGSFYLWCCSAESCGELKLLIV